jgi:hypothetical protein
MDRPFWHPSAPFQVPPTVLPSQPRRLVRSVLAAWTGVLIILVVSASRTIPPVILGFLLPYLAMVAWHILAAPGRAETDRDLIPEDSAAKPRPDVNAEVAIPASLASPDSDTHSSEAPEANLAPGEEGRPPTTAQIRARRRGRPKVVPDPSPASWVQVGPGRFVRGEEPQPSPGSSVEVEPMAHSPETLRDLVNDRPHDNPLADDAATEGLVVGDPAGLTEVPVTAPGASQPRGEPVHLLDDEDHFPMVEAVPADSARIPG